MEEDVKQIQSTGLCYNIGNRIKLTLVHITYIRHCHSFLEISNQSWLRACLTCESTTPALILHTCFRLFFFFKWNLHQYIGYEVRYKTWKWSVSCHVTGVIGYRKVNWYFKWCACSISVHPLLTGNIILAALTSVLDASISITFLFSLQQIIHSS